MANSNPGGEAYFDATEHFSTYQLTALADWAKSMSGVRLATVKKQLAEAILAYQPGKDEALVGLSLAARSDAVQKEIQSRDGEIPKEQGLIVPWGKSTTDEEKWSLTDYTKLPPQEYRGFVQPEERPQKPLPKDPRIPRAAQQYDPNDSHPLVMGNGLPGDNIVNFDDFDQFVKVSDPINDPDEAESYRMADNDFSGLSIISTEVIDVDEFSDALEEILYTADDNSNSLNEDSFHTAMEDPIMKTFAEFNAAGSLSHLLEDFPVPQEGFSGAEGQHQAENIDDDMLEFVDPKSLRTEWVSDPGY